MEIKEILRNKDNYYCAFTEPLLEYVEKVANHFWKDFDPDAYYKDEEGNLINDGICESSIPNGFGLMYVNGGIDITGKDTYISNEELQNTLKAFDLDTSKFWYLCLCIKTYVKILTVNAPKKRHSHRTHLKDLVAEMDKMQPKIVEDKIDVTKGGTLTFKIDGGKKITITDSQTISLINIAIGNMIGQYKNKNIPLLDNISTDNQDTITLPYIYQIYLFNMYLSWFLKPLKAKKGVFASKDKSFLISQIIYILGISNDKKFITEYKDNGDKLDHLKNMLKRYKDIEIPTYSNLFLW